MKKEFTKSDLKSGMIIEYKNKAKRTVIKTDGTIIGIGLHNKWVDFCNFDSYLNHSSFKDRNVVKIYYPIDKSKLVPCNYFCLTKKDLIWERQEEPEKKQLTVAQIEEKLGYPVEVVRG